VLWTPMKMNENMTRTVAVVMQGFSVCVSYVCNLFLNTSSSHSAWLLLSACLRPLSNNDVALKNWTSLSQLIRFLSLSPCQSLSVCLFVYLPPSLPLFARARAAHSLSLSLSHTLTHTGSH